MCWTSLKIINNLVVAIIKLNYYNLYSTWLHACSSKKLLRGLAQQI